MTGEKQKEQHETPAEPEIDYKELLMRLQAEFENYKKRAVKEQEQQAAAYQRELVKKLLPVLDSFEMALLRQPDKGIEMLYAQLAALLRAEGLAPIEALGKQLDPYLHDVMLQEPSEQDGIILEELQRGYLLHGEVLRHSKVKVGVYAGNTETAES